MLVYKKGGMWVMHMTHGSLTPAPGTALKGLARPPPPPPGVEGLGSTWAS